MEINREAMEAALEKLCSTDEAYAATCAIYDSLVNMRPSVRSRIFMALPKEGAVQAREHAAQNHPDYIKHLNDIDRANEKMLILRNQRATAHTVIDCWRSLNAARNKGQIV